MSWEHLLDAHDTGDALLGLDLNGIRNVVHLVLGLVGLGRAVGLQRSCACGVVLLVAGAALFVFGLVAVGDDHVNVLRLNWPATS